MISYSVKHSESCLEYVDGQVQVQFVMWVNQVPNAAVVHLAKGARDACLRRGLSNSVTTVWLTKRCNRILLTGFAKVNTFIQLSAYTVA